MANYYKRHLHKGSWERPSATSFVAANHEIVVTVNSGAGRVSELISAATSHPIYHLAYTKTGGIYAPGDANKDPDQSYGYADYTNVHSVSKLGFNSQDLFWYTSGSVKTTQTQNGWFYADIINATKRQKWIDIYVDLIEFMDSYKHCDGFMMDNCGALDPSLIAPGYGVNYTDSAYYNACLDILANLRSAFPSKFILINSYSGQFASGLRGLEMLQYADAIMSEFHSWKASGTFHTPTRYRQQVNDSITGLGTGKRWVNLDYTTQVNTQKRMLSAGSFFLAWDGSDQRLVNYDLADDTSTDADYYPEFDVDLGIPVGRYTDNTQYLTRNFTMGKVYVNPSNTTVSIPITNRMESLSVTGGAAWNDSAKGVQWNVVTGGSISLAANSAAILRDGRYSIVVGGRTRYYYLHLPSSLPAGKVPVVVALHPGATNAAAFVAMSGWNTIADLNGFAVVWPEGTPDGTTESWNAVGCCGYPVTNNIDDQAFILAVLNDIKTKFSPDMARVYVTGFSVGGELAQRLAVENTSKFAAVAAVNGTLTTLTEPGGPTIPVMVIHGTGDTHVPYSGGVGANALVPYNYPAVETQEMPFWCTRNGNSTTPTTSAQTGYNILTYPGTVPVQLYKLTGTGHVYTTGLLSPSTSSVIWSFFNGKVRKPVPGLVVTPSSGNVPLTVTADGSSSTDLNGTLQYSFDFGSGFGAYQSSATSTFTYSTPGTYTVRLQVKSVTGDVSDITTYSVAVGSSAAVATLTANPTSGPAPLSTTLSLTGTGGGRPYQYVFDFGEGSGFGAPQVSNTISHTYSSSGAYTARGKILDSFSVESNISTTTITTSGAPSVTSFTSTPSSGSSPLTTTLSASASGGIPPYQYSFDFGEGAGFGSYSSSSSTPHVYSTFGSYTARVRVQDSVGLVSATATTSVSVNSAPVASFTLSTYLSFSSTTVTINASGSSDPDGNTPLQYAYDTGSGFGSWTSSSSSSVTLLTPGLYSIRVKVKDSTGLESSVVTKKVRILGARSSKLMFKGSWTSSNATENTFVATKYAFHVGENSGSSRIAGLRTAANPNSVVFLRYTKVGGVHITGTNSPHGDFGYADYTDANGTVKPGAVSQNLLWKTSTGTTVTNTDNGWAYIDILDATKRQKWIQIIFDKIDVMDKDSVTEGLFFDNTCTLLSSFVTPGFGVGYSDSAYYAACLDIITQVKARYPEKFVMFNTYAGYASTGNRGLEILNVADAILSEGQTGLKADGSFFDPTRYRQNLTDAITAVNSGKIFVMTDYVTQSPTQKRLFSAGTYYLITNNSTSYYYPIVTDSTTDVDYPVELTVDLGNPLGAYTDNGTILKREFQRGTVLVNPSASSSTITLSGSKRKYLVISGGTAYNASTTSTWRYIGNTVTVPARSCMILKPFLSITSVPTGYKGFWNLSGTGSVDSLVKNVGDQFSWSSFNPSEGTYNWSATGLNGGKTLSQLLALPTSGNGCIIKLLSWVVSGSGVSASRVPQWVLTKHTPRTITAPDGSVSVVPWNVGVLSEFQKFVSAFATQFASSSNLWGVQVGAWGNVDEEMVIDNSYFTTLQTAATADGYTFASSSQASQLLEDSIGDVIRTWEESFGSYRWKLTWSGPTQLFNLDNTKQRLADIANTEHEIGLNGSTIETYWDKVGTNAPYYNSTLDSNGYLQLGDSNPVITDNRYFGDELNIYQGFYSTSTNPNDHYFRTSALMALERRLKFLLVNSSILDIDRELSAYLLASLGSTVSTSKDAWCALYHSKIQVNGVCKTLNNLERWMYQRDISNYVTTPTQNMKRIQFNGSGFHYACNASDPYGASLGSPSPNSEFIARKTSPLAGNTGIGFYLDSEFAATGVTLPITLKITYLDTGSPWWIEYTKTSTTSSTHEIPVSGDGRVKTASISLSDFTPTRLLNGVFDFAIVSSANQSKADGGAATVYMARVIKN